MSLHPGEITVDIFAGAGGAGLGVASAIGRPVDVAVNHDGCALAVYRANSPQTRILEADVWEVRPQEATGGRPVGVAWFSPDCTHFSSAKGGKPRKQEIRSLGWVVPRWAAAVRPRIIFVENVPEYLTWGPLGEDGRPVKARQGVTFIRWRQKLERLGYRVEYRKLDSSAYGARTRRKRLFIIARCDGQPIVWPEPTHGPGLLPYHTAAECIDWSLACPSIFERGRPLADKTLWRIAQGIMRYVLQGEPFVVKMKGEAHSSGAWEPVPTITAQGPGLGLAVPTLIQTGYGEREGQAARVPGLFKPLGTMVNGQKHALVAAYLAKHFGGVVGIPVDQPASTITARDHHSLAAATLVKLRGDCHGADLSEPMPAVTAQGWHIAEVRAFLTAYFGNDGGAGKGQSLNSPARTITARHRLGLVTVAGNEYQIVDIGMRMLQPHELLAAQFGRYAEAFDMSPAKTKSEQVRLIGNSVPPEMAEAVVRANVRPEQVREDVA